MDIVFSPESRQDLREIFDYIAQDNLEGAIGFVRRLRERCAGLAAMPNVGRKRDEIAEGFRSITEGDYVIFYRERQGQLEILHILHGRRDIKKIFPGAED